MTKPHKHAEVIKAWAEGAEIQFREMNGAHGWGGWHDHRSPAWSTNDKFEYRIRPKIVKTRVRVAAMGEPNGEGLIWVWSVHTDEHAAQTERNRHFLCWLGDWHEVDRPEPPVEDTLSVGCINAAKISAGTINDGMSPLGELHAMGFGPAKRGADRTVVWYPNGRWARWL